MSVNKSMLALLLVLCFSMNTQAEVKLTISPEYGLMGGTTEYELDIQGSFIDSVGTTPIFTKRRITSLLEYPLDVSIGGISGLLRSVEDPNRWLIQLKYLTNLNDPSSKMIDSDWDEIKSKFAYMKWSETESDAKMNMNILDVELRFRIAQKRTMDISIIAGGRYQKIKQNLFGLEGWQKKFIDSLNVYNDTLGFFSGFENVNGLYYEIEIKQFKIGLQSDIYLSNKLTSQLRFAFAPASYKDFDDHILRNKLSTSKGEGNGYISGLNLRYNKPFGGLSFIQLNSSYNYFSANGPQTQEWDGDDPSTPDDDTGNITEGIPHTVRTKQYSISLEVGFEL